MRTGKENWLAAVISGFDTYYRKLGLTEQKRVNKEQEKYRQQAMQLSREQLIQEAQKLNIEKSKLDEQIRGNKASEADRQKYYNLQGRLATVQERLATVQEKQETRLQEAGAPFPPVGSGAKGGLGSDEIMRILSQDYDTLSQQFGRFTSAEEFNKDFIARRLGITLTPDQFKQLQNNNQFFQSYFRDKVAKYWMGVLPKYSDQMQMWVTNPQFAAAPPPSPPKEPRRGLFGIPPAGQQLQSQMRQQYGLSQGTQGLIQNRTQNNIQTRVPAEQTTGAGTRIGAGRPNMGLNQPSRPDYNVAKPEGGFLQKMGAGLKRFFGEQPQMGTVRQQVFINNSLFYVNPDNTVTDSAGNPITNSTVLDMVFKELEKQKRQTQPKQNLQNLLGR